jgi:hypothetical protein
MFSVGGPDTSRRMEKSRAKKLEALIVVNKGEYKLILAFVRL